MKGIEFPIASINENHIISTAGVSSFFFELDTVDFEQLTDSELYSFYEGISRSLNTLNESSFYKFYSWNKKKYLNSNEATPSLHNTNIIPCNRPLDSFFGNIDIYSDIGIYDDYVSFNGNYWRVLSLKSFSADEITPYLIPEDFDYVLTFKRNTPTKSLNELEKIRNSHQSSFYKNKRDIESEGAYEQAEELIYEITHSQESIFTAELYIVAKAFSVEMLNNKTQEIISSMNKKGISLFIEGHSLKRLKSGLAHIFNDLIPGTLPKLELRSFPDKTSHLRYLLPLSTSNLMDKGIKLKDSTFNTIMFNPFDESVKNRNMLVTGSSGGGKSVFVNKLIYELSPSHPTVILDKDGSFKKTTLFRDGTIMGKSFNPMHFKCPSYLKELILSCVDQEAFSQKDEGKLFSTIKRTVLKNKNITFMELIRELEHDFTGISYYFEEINEYFDDMELDYSKILYIDIESFPKKIISPLIIYTLEYFKSIPKKEKILVFDECWAFLRDHSNFIDECFRTIRKKGAFLVAITQGISDFARVSTDFFNSISNNSYFKLYFQQEHIESSSIDQFDNDRIKGLILEKGHFSECYLKTDDNKIRKIIRLYLTDIEHELFHTEAGLSEALFRHYKNNRDVFHSFEEAVASFVRLRRGA